MKRRTYLNTFYRTNKRKIATVLALIFLIDIASPTAAWALTGGPTQPEMSSFEPISTNQMVDLFSGDFTYNIPLMDVGGYPINIAYHAGVGMEQEASWVGLGWNINPGVINRSVRGIPDDFDGDVIERKINIRDDKTLSIKAGLDFELIGLKMTKKTKTSNNKGKGNGNLRLGMQFFYNNYKGFYIAPDIGYSMQLNASSESKMKMGLNLGISQNAQNGLSAHARPTLSIGNEDSKVSGVFGLGGATYNARTQSLNLSLAISLSLKSNMVETESSKIFRKFVKDFNIKRSSLSRRSFKNDGNGGKVSSGPSATIPIGQNTYLPNSAPQMESAFGNLRISGGTELWSMDPAFYFDGTYSERSLVSKTKNKAAYGYLYLQNRPIDMDDKYEGLTDFNRDGASGSFNPNMSYLAPANMTYDILSVSAQGTGGMFRPFRNDIGVVSDASMANKGLNGASIGVEIGAGGTARFGGDVSVKSSTDASNNWHDPQIWNYQFRQNKKGDLKENVYYKAAGEIVPVSETFNALGGEKLRTFTLLNDEKLTSQGMAVGREVSYDQSQGLSPRQPRGKLVTTLNGEEASVVGLDKKILSYPSTYKGLTSPSDEPRVSSTRKSHHTSQITQIQKDGSRYVFGIPAMNKLKKEVVFNAEELTGTNGLVNYGSDSPDENDERGTDYFYSETKTPAYAHSYLLSGYLSADYVDVTGDGITADDLGNAVKFNYTKVHDNMGWRTPLGANNANYHQGNEADIKDDRGSYTYGEKEMWYLQSIESRNFIAVFTITDRNDAKGVTEHGVTSSDKSKKLTKIEMYSKEDLAQNGTSAVPIKVVEFGYFSDTGGLCKGAPNNITNGTKLTLKSISFKFGDNTASAFDPYTFEYNRTYNNTSTSGIVGDYNSRQVDNWGNFKGENLASLSKEDYPYSNQVVSKSVVDSWASLWNLKKISLPSGGEINVKYESDDYSYVQDKPAMEMLRVVGASNTSDYDASEARKELFSGGGAPSKQKYFLIFELPSYVTSGSSPTIKDNRLDEMFKGVDNLYYRMKMKVKDGITDHNYVNGYVTIDNSQFGLCSNSSSHGYVKLNQFKGGSTGRREMNPIVANAMSFYDQYMPDMVSPGGGVPAQGDYKALAKKFVSIFPDLLQAIIGPVKYMLANGVGQKFDTEKSFIRLVKADHKKYGGGHRVTSIELKDNWTNDASGISSYGQRYEYKMEDNTSSGVASFEPLIGADQNPLRQPTKYQMKKNPGLSPNWDLYQETPMGESFYPPATVGYSRVIVRNFNNEKPSAGFYKESKFYTTKEFPVKFNSSKIQVKEPSKWAGKFKPPVGYWKTKKYFTSAQGYTFILNDMHGKLWQENHYSNKNNKPIRLSGKEYIYNGTDPRNNDFDMDNVVQAVLRNGKLGNVELGRELDITIDTKEVFHRDRSRNVQGSLDLIPVGFLPFPLPMILYLEDVNEIQYRSVVVTKIIQNYGLLSDIVEYDMNREVKTSNVLYDGHSGDLLVSKVENEFGESILNSSLPAYWAQEYDLMGHAYRNIGFKDDGGQKVTILDCEFDVSQLQYMKHFVYEGLMDSYIENHRTYNGNFGTLTEIFGNLVTKNVFVPGDEIYDLSQADVLDKHLWAVSVLDDAMVNQMVNDNPGDCVSSITGISTTETELKCEGVLTEPAFLTRISTELPIYSGLSTSSIQSFTSALIDYSNSTTSSATASDVCGYLNYFPLNSKDPSTFIGSEGLTDFGYLLNTQQAGATYSYQLNQTSELTKIILDNNDIKGLLNLFVNDGVGANSLTIQQRTSIFEYIMGDVELLNYMKCQMDYPSILQFISKLGCNQNAFDFVRYVLKNENKIFEKATSAYDPIVPPNSENQQAGSGTGNGNVTLKSLFSSLGLPINYWTYTLEASASNPATLSLDYCNRHLFVDCNYSFAYTASTTSSTADPQDMDQCCTFDNQTFDMTGKDLVIFINRDGEIVDVAGDELKIVRSGRRNLLTAKVGEVSSFEYGPFATNYLVSTERNKYFTQDKVLNASAMEYSENWVTDRVLVTPLATTGRVNTSVNPYVYGIRGNFRPKSGYYINDNRNDLGAGNGQTPNLTKDGTFSDFTPFWEFAGKMNKLAKTSTWSTNWIKSSDITYYSSVNGNSIEERTPLDLTGNNEIYTTELIGQHNLASAVANNARHTDILFEDFELHSRATYIREHSNLFSSVSSSITNKAAHSGKSSLYLGLNTSHTMPISTDPLYQFFPSAAEISGSSIIVTHPGSPTNSISVGIPVADIGAQYGERYLLDKFNPNPGYYIISGWVKDGFINDYSFDDNDANTTSSDVTVNYQTTASLTINGIDCLANIEESPFIEGWQRFEVKFPVATSTTALTLAFDGGRFGAYFDDIRIYPQDAVMKTYVYHPYVMRLSALLDENNYATFYDYDLEGNLIRIRKETERGIMTIQESSKHSK